MKEVKMVFVEADEGDVEALVELLDHIPQDRFFFVVVPAGVKALSREDAVRLLQAALNNC